MGKGEIARYEQFLLFHIVFKRLVLQTRKNLGLFGKGSILWNNLYSYLFSRPLQTLFKNVTQNFDRNRYFNKQEDHDGPISLTWVLSSAD